MNSVINFMIDNFLLFVIIVILVILAVIGYMVEEARLEKLKKEYLKQAKKVFQVVKLHLTMPLTK